MEEGKYHYTEVKKEIEVFGFSEKIFRRKLQLQKC